MPLWPRGPWKRRRHFPAESAECTLHAALRETNRHCSRRLRLGTGRADRADKLSAEALATAPSLEKRLLRAQVLTAFDRVNEAIETRRTPVAGVVRAEDRATEAALLLASKQSDAALAALDAPLALEPSRISAKLRKAKLLLRMKQQPAFVEVDKDTKTDGNRTSSCGRGSGTPSSTQESEIAPPASTRQPHSCRMQAFDSQRSRGCAVTR
jgi:hypothetical protein